MGAEIQPDSIDDLGSAFTHEGLSVRELVLEQLHVIWLGPYELAILLDKTPVRVFLLFLTMDDMVVEHSRDLEVVTPDGAMAALVSSYTTYPI